jgi:hypothetical protein
MTYRETATSLAQRTSGNFIGAVFYRPMPWAKIPAKWYVTDFPSAQALVEWYEEISPSTALYYYIAVFDKAYSNLPVAESIATPQPDDLGWDAYNSAVRSGYRWKPGAFPTGYKERAAHPPARVGAELPKRDGAASWFPLAFVGTMLGVAYVATSRAVAKIKRDRPSRSE